MDNILMAILTGDNPAITAPLNHGQCQPLHASTEIPSKAVSGVP
jgi:hypothetical protein